MLMRGEWHAVSMYFLVLFYHVTQKELKPFNPVSKFLCIKLVIMFAFWQGIIMALLGWFGVLNEHNVDLGKDWKSEEEIGTYIPPSPSGSCVDQHATHPRLP